MGGKDRGPRDTVRGTQSKPRAGSRLTVGKSKLVQAYCQMFLSVFISSARAITKNVVVNENTTQDLNKQDLGKQSALANLFTDENNV